MSAVLETFRQDALEREQSGFATMQTHPLGFFVQSGDLWSTANQTVVVSDTTSGSYVVAYEAPHVDYMATIAPWNIDVRKAGIVRSDSFLVRRQANTATMSGGQVLVISFGDIHERGVIALEIPRKMVHSQVVSFNTAQLKRKTPSVMLGGRTYGEENA